MMSDSQRFNPWDIQSLYELQVFDCPECAFQEWSKQTFIYHAIENHPESIQYLSNIQDDSLEGIDIPWLNKSDTELESKDLQVSEDTKLEFTEDSSEIIPNVTVKVEDPMDRNVSENDCQQEIVNTGVNYCKRCQNHFPNSDELATHDCYLPDNLKTIEEMSKPSGIPKTDPTTDTGKQIEDLSNVELPTNENLILMFRCEICLKKFSWKNNLKRHKMEHHNDVATTDIEKQKFYAKAVQISI